MSEVCSVFVAVPGEFAPHERVAELIVLVRDLEGCKLISGL